MKKPNCSWILVANRANAKLFEHRPGARHPIVLLRELEHPEGRLKAGEINAEKSGRSFQRVGPGSSALEKAQDPTEHEAEHFAIVLADMLAEERARESFAHLVLVSEPRFLGTLRRKIEPATRERIDYTVLKDIAGLEARALAEELEILVGGELPRSPKHLSPRL
jgi:protein required for attachment to host cells